MSENSHPAVFSRRRFLERHCGSSAALGVGLALLPRGALEAGSADPNPFAYDVSRFERTDPKLVRYTELRRFRSPQPEPRRLALAPDGHLLLAAGNGITRLTPEGVTMAEMPLDGPPHCVAAAGDGLLYVGMRDRIEVLDAQGKSKARWTPIKGRPWLSGLAVDDTELFAADASNRVLLRYDRSGKLIARLGQRDARRNVPGFVLPSPYLDVEIHRDGLLRVNNPGRHRVEVYTRDGDFELAWGKATAAIEGFCGCCNPINLALLPDGRHVTCEKGLPRVKIYSREGHFECVVAGTETFPELTRPGGGSPSSRGAPPPGLDAVVDREGRVCILDMAAAEVRVMERRAI